MKYTSLFHTSVVLVLICQLSDAAGEGIQNNVDKSILTITSELNSASLSAEQSEVSFSLASLEEIGLTSIKTETPWTNGIIHFEGVLVRRVLESTGFRGTAVFAYALDDYVVEIPITDFTENDVILATRQNGKPMSVRNNGPVWIIYPWSDDKSLHRPHYYSRSIWQLELLKVK